MDEGFVNHEAPPGTPPGLGSVTMFMNLLSTAFSDQHWTMQQVIAEGDLVAIHCIHSGRHTGNFFGLPATGRSFSYQQMHLIKLRDGKGVEQWGVRDDAGLMRQLTAAASRDWRLGTVVVEDGDIEILTAEQFADRLTEPTRMGEVFALAKRFIDLELDQIEQLLESSTQKVRVGAVSVMDFQARRRSTPASRREELYRAVPAPSRSHQRLVSGRSRRAIGGRRLSTRQAPRAVVPARAFRVGVGTAYGHRRHLALHPAWAARRHLRDR